MATMRMPKFPSSNPPDGSLPPPLPRTRANLVRTLVAVCLALVVIYAAYVWCIRRVVVGADQVLVLVKKDGGRSLPGDQLIIPQPPDAATNAAGREAWEKQYGDCNGILEQVYLTGTYFTFSPFDYERIVLPLGNADVPANKVGVVVRKFGAKLADGQVLADEARGQRGPLQRLLAPGKYYQYANPYAYEIKLVDPVLIKADERGVVTLMAAKPAREPNEYLVDKGEQGVQKIAEPQGFVYVNPFEKRITPISIHFQPFHMAGDDAITFPSSDGFQIRMEAYVGWAIMPDRLPLMYMQYGEGGPLIPYLQEKVILPYARSLCRVIGSEYSARELLSGDGRVRLENEFRDQLRAVCEKQGIVVYQASVRDIVPPEEIKNLINEREIARQQIKSLQQQIQVAKSQAELVTQTEMGNQNQKIGDANTQVVTIVKKAEQEHDVAVTKAEQELSVAKLRLEAAQQEADAMTARGQAEASVILLQRQAEAEPLRQQVQAFGDGSAYAQFFFFQKVAPSIKTILANTDGPFGDLFKQFATPATPSGKGGAGQKVTEVQP